jgi:serine/threonine protein kinase
MGLSAGTRLGVYEIVAAIGAGSMGEVYRGHDTRLNRDVAIKVLPSHFTVDSQHLARFEREAQVLASLNHPNIAQIYGLEERDGTRALVMEFVDGSDLAVCLSRGPIAIDEALAIAEQIAHGLEAAHEFGIVHRDLKPANIKVRPDGTVKLLDFGLAKALDPAASMGSGVAEQSPTITSPAMMTHHGIILGTAAYMAPEQARGKTVDKRADIFAFGAVLYEMLTGRRLFRGDTVTDTLSAVLTVEPDWSALPAKTPVLIKRLLRLCLTKDPRQRLGDIRDARIDITEARAARSTDGGMPAATGVSKRLLWSLAAACALLSVLLAASLLRPWQPARSAPSEALLMRFDTRVPEGFTMSPLESPAISPDGRFVVVRSAGTPGGLWLRRIDSLEAQMLAGTENAEFPFWAPDSRRIGFFSRGRLRTLEIESGAVNEVAAAQAPRGGAWSSSNVIVFAPANAGPLTRVSVDGGTPAPASTITDPAESHRWPIFLPDGRRFVFYVSGTSFHLRIGTLDSLESSELTPADGSAQFAPPDLLLFVRGGRLVAQPFDPARLAMIGDAMTLNEDVAATQFRLSRFSVSGTGTLVYSNPAFRADTLLAWADRKGTLTRLDGSPVGRYLQAILSHDGRTVALVAGENTGSNLVIFDTAAKTMSKRTFEGVNDGPLWAPDDTFLVFRKFFQAPPFIVRMRAEGGQTETMVPNDKPGLMFPTSLSADGRLLAFTNVGDVFVRDETGVVRPVLNTAANEAEAQFAPDGRLLAYMSDEIGRPEVFVQRYPPDGSKWQLSTSGGTSPVWARNGRELFFRNGNDMVSVPVELSPTFKHGAPITLFSRPLAVSRFSVSADGQRFLVVARDDTAPPPPPAPITVVVNWREQLKRPQ